MEEMTFTTWKFLTEVLAIQVQVRSGMRKIAMKCKAGRTSLREALVVCCLEVMQAVKIRPCSRGKAKTLKIEQPAKAGEHLTRSPGHVTHVPATRDDSDSPTSRESRA